MGGAIRGGFIQHRKPADLMTVEIADLMTSGEYATLTSEGALVHMFAVSEMSAPVAIQVDIGKTMGMQPSIHECHDLFPCTMRLYDLNSNSRTTDRFGILLTLGKSTSWNRAPSYCLWLMIPGTCGI